MDSLHISLDDCPTGSIYSCFKSDESNIRLDPWILLNTIQGFKFWAQSKQTHLPTPLHYMWKVHHGFQFYYPNVRLHPMAQQSMPSLQEIQMAIWLTTGYTVKQKFSNNLWHPGNKSPINLTTHSRSFISGIAGVLNRIGIPFSDPVADTSNFLAELLHEDLPFSQVMTTLRSTLLCTTPK